MLRSAPWCWWCVASGAGCDERSTGADFDHPQASLREEGARAGSTIRYLGSKARIVGSILDAIGRPTPKSSRFVDIFSGTGVVSREAASRGWRVFANDHLHSAAILTTAHLLSGDDVAFVHFGG